MSLLKWIVNKVKLLVLCFINSIRRSLCCFSRRRVSIDDDTIILTDVISSTYTKSKEDDMNWNANWGKKPSTIEEHIEHFREKKFRGHQNEEETEEVNVDFFEDMTPKIIPQKKILLNTRNQKSNEMSSRLQLSADPSLLIQPDLVEWEDSEKLNSWEDADEFNTSQIIRDQRRAERERRVIEQQRKKQERDMMKMMNKHSLATKIS